MKVVVHKLNNGKLTLEIKPNAEEPATFINMHICDLELLNKEIQKELKSYCHKYEDDDFCSGDVCDFR